MSRRGWTGRIARVDLNTGRVVTEEPAAADLARDLGGRGLAGRILSAAGPRDWDDPELPFVLAAGPLVGTIAPTPGRATLMCRSPLTGAAGDSSVGGRLGATLKRAGFDALVLTGRAPRLSGLLVEDGSVRLADAGDLAGAGTDTVFARLKDWDSVACVGPAAESGSLLASVQVDRHHAAGRGGLGLALAARGVKFIALRGGRKVPVADPALLKAAREEILRLTHASPALMGAQGFSCFGTGAIFDLMDSRRMMPTDNFRRTRFPGAAGLNAYAYKARYRPEKHGCHGCHIRCKKVAEDGRSMPEFETMSHFTALIGNTDPDLVVAANAACNRLGLDTISAGSALACHRELTGRDLAPEAVLGLLYDMGHGHGPGADLARGAARYAAAHGRPELAMAVKGLELPAYDPRGAYGMALAYAVSTRGGCHLRAYPVSHEILRKPVATDRFTFSGKARIVKIAEDGNAVVDSLTACKFVFFAASLEEYAKAYAAVTGVESSAQDLLRLGERICYRERMMNAAWGFTAEHDDLPPRFFAEPGDSAGELPVPPLDRAEFLKARAAYYRIRGLDPEGRPTAETAARLELA
ncbi:MAG: aldehyde ferredoxin oxidoreductase family protein [Thermodesulfobacteriota bacterium]